MSNKTYQPENGYILDNTSFYYDLGAFQGFLENSIYSDNGYARADYTANVINIEALSGKDATSRHIFGTLIADNSTPYGFDCSNIKTITISFRVNSIHTPYGSDDNRSFIRMWFAPNRAVLKSEDLTETMRWEPPYHNLFEISQPEYLIDNTSTAPNITYDTQAYTYSTSGDIHSLTINTQYINILDFKAEINSSSYSEKTSIDIVEISTVPIADGDDTTATSETINIIDIPGDIVAKSVSSNTQNIYTNLFTFKSDIINNTITLEMPRHTDKYRPWYPYIKNGNFSINKGYENNHYGVPEYYYQDFDIEPNITTREKVAINKYNRNSITLPDTNIILDDNFYTYSQNGDNYKIPNGINVYNKNDKIFHVYDWDLTKGKFYILENFDDELLFADYKFINNYFHYKGYYLNHEFIKLNLNVNPGNTYIDPNAYRGEEESVIRETNNLNNSIVYFYLKPEYKTKDNRIIPNSKSPSTVFHTLYSPLKSNHKAIADELKENKYEFEDIVLLGKIYVNMSQDSDLVKTIDTRTRGGGITNKKVK